MASAPFLRRAYVESKRIDFRNDPIDTADNAACGHLSRDHYMGFQALHKAIGNECGIAFVWAGRGIDERDLPIDRPRIESAEFDAEF